MYFFCECECERGRTKRDTVKQYRGGVEKSAKAAPCPWACGRRRGGAAGAARAGKAQPSAAPAPLPARARSRSPPRAECARSAPCAHEPLTAARYTGACAIHSCLICYISRQVHVCNLTDTDDDVTDGSQIGYHRLPHLKCSHSLSYSTKKNEITSFYTTVT